MEDASDPISVEMQNVTRNVARFEPAVIVCQQNTIGRQINGANFERSGKDWSWKVVLVGENGCPDSVLRQGVQGISFGNNDRVAHLLQYATNELIVFTLVGL